MTEPIIPLIMCGGAGTRLWPASRENRPKQFLPLFGTLSTFQETVRRVADPALFARPIVVTNGQYRFLVAEQLAAIGAEADVLLEPARRDSGPAIAAGAGYALTRDDGAVVVALAADHVVTDPAAFAKVCTLAPRRRRGGSDRHVRRRADAAGDRVRLHPARPFARSRPVRDRKVRRKARRRDRGALPGRGLSVELGQFHVPRALPARRIPPLRAATAPRRSRPRSRPPAPISASSRSASTRSPGPPRNRSTTR